MNAFEKETTFMFNKEIFQHFQESRLENLQAIIYAPLTNINVKCKT